MCCGRIEGILSPLCGVATTLEEVGDQMQLWHYLASEAERATTMFGRNRRLATEHTIAAVRPLIGIFQNFSGMPGGFWRDEYVLGFIGFMISFHANYTSGRKLSQEDKGYLLFETFTALSNRNGQAIGREYTRLASADKKSPDFEEGADNAAICAFASIGQTSDQGRPFFETEKQIAFAQGAGNDHSAIVGILIHMLFFEKVRARFDA